MKIDLLESTHDERNVRDTETLNRHGERNLKIEIAVIETTMKNLIGFLELNF